MGLRIWLREKTSAVKIPIWAGQIVSTLPYEIRPGLGRTYLGSKRMIGSFAGMEDGQKKDWIFQRVKGVVESAERKIPFYRDLYREQGFDPASLNSFEDLKRIPIIDKKMLLGYQLDARSDLRNPGYLVNTGGTSGATLGLYIHPDQMGNEWSHMHHIWGKLGFKPRDLKLMLTGRSEFKEGLHYDFARHSLSISVYAEIDQLAGALTEIVKRCRPAYIHGYPSALYEFALACRAKQPALLDQLRGSLRGGFLGSEYPVRLFRETIEDLFGIPTISWYGHTERCILAYEERDPYLYSPFQTYGYTEVVEDGAGDQTLVGTGYYNLASPLIRYNTEDQVADFGREGGLLSWFRIKEGRVGEFILDENGKKIPLTGLIFGRHHDLFNHCTHIQIHQERPGYADVLYVPLDKDHLPDPRDLFDSRNVKIQFEFKMLKEPLRTSAGKVKLLVDENTYQG